MKSVVKFIIKTVQLYFEIKENPPLEVLFTMKFQIHISVWKELALLFSVVMTCTMFLYAHKDRNRSG